MWLSAVDDETAMLLRSVNGGKKGKKKGKAKAKKDANAPKKPMTAYFLFRAPVF